MSIDIFSDFATDTAAEESGTWVPYAGDVEFLIARFGNKKFAKMFAQQYKLHKRVIETKSDAAEQKSDEITVDTYAETILLGWRGDMTFKGEKLEYSKANAKLLLGVKDFREWVHAQASEMANFKTEQDEADAKK